MPTPSTQSGGAGRGVETNGIGKPCSSHLNLTRSLADVDWHGADHPTRGTDNFPRPPYDPRSRERIHRIRFAGAE